jgi:Zeta toxin
VSDLDPHDFLLPQAVSEKIFRTRIVPALLEGASPQDSPVLVVLSAQQGAGKSTLARDLRAAFPASAAPVIVDVDSFKAFYPGILDLQRSHGPVADDLVHADARRWLTQALAHLRDQQVNVIAELGLRNREVTQEVLSQFGQAGYLIEAALLATPAAQSMLGILERYQWGHERTGYGRPVSGALHDERYRQLETVADWLQGDSRVRAVGVYLRGEAVPAHRLERAPDGTWEPGPTACATLIAERERPWSLEDSRSFLRHYHSLRARVSQQWIPELDRARDAAAPYLHPDAGVPAYSQPAVTFGRYQIVSIAHLDTIRTMLMDWPSVEIGVLDMNAQPATPVPVPDHLREFYQECEANTAPPKNPMSTEQRAEFWRATLAAAGLQDRVTVRVIPRPELYPGNFNAQYPTDRFHLAFPTVGGAGFDAIRNDCFAEILGRPVYPVDPPLEYHTSDIRKAYREGNVAWRNGFAPGGLEAFIAADGPRVLLGEQRSAPADARIQQAARLAAQGVPLSGRATAAAPHLDQPSMQPPGPGQRRGR